MRAPLKIGFVALVDAAPLIVAAAKGMFAQAGLAVELVREISWATVRDKLGVGALDGAHLLAPLAVALRARGEGAPLIAPYMINRGGAAVTLSSRIARQGDPAAALRRVVAMRREQGSTPLTFAVVFPDAIHNHLLRAWLADAGVDPDKDVHVTVAPPSRMADLLAQGVIEGFCAGEPWNAAAVASGVGEVVARASARWPAAPDKVLAVGEGWAEAEPQVLAALLSATGRAAAWCADPANRPELVGLLADPAHLDANAAAVDAGLADVRFDESAPTAADASWLVAQMRRWSPAPDEAALATAAARVFRPELYDRAMAADA